MSKSSHGSVRSWDSRPPHARAKACSGRRRRAMTTMHPLWVFDDSPIPDPLGHGERAVKFFDALRHPKSDHPNKRLGLAPFWQRIIKRVYGPRDAQGRRLVRTVFLMMPRGARKTTTIGGGLGLYHSVGH